LISKVESGEALKRGLSSRPNTNYAYTRLQTETRILYEYYEDKELIP
jgi:hypothetical protein